MGNTAFWEAAYKWQGLVAGVLAIAAAVVGGGFVARQTAHADGHEQERRRARFAAARAVLPLTLTNICDYATWCGGLIKDVLDDWTRKQTFPHGHILQHVDFPSDIIADLRLFIEAADQVAGRYAANLIVMIQIMSARDRDLVLSLQRIGSPLTIYTKSGIARMIADWAEIYAVSESLLSYARGQSSAPPENPPFNAFQLTVALEKFGLSQKAHSTVFAAVEASAASKSGLWDALRERGQVEFGWFDPLR